MLIRDVRLALAFVLLGSISQICSNNSDHSFDFFELSIAPNRIDMIVIDFYAIKRSAYFHAQSAALKHKISSGCKQAIKTIIDAALHGEKNAGDDLTYGLTFFPEEVQKVISAERERLFKRHCCPESIETVQQALEGIQAFYTKYSLFVNKFLLQWYEQRINLRKVIYST